MKQIKNIGCFICLVSALSSFGQQPVIITYAGGYRGNLIDTRHIEAIVCWPPTDSKIFNSGLSLVSGTRFRKLTASVFGWASTARSRRTSANA
jgi:hypothetical protein